MYGVVFRPGPPGPGQLVFWTTSTADGTDPAGGPGELGELGEPAELTVAVPDGTGGVRTQAVPARRVALADALPGLVEARHAAPPDGGHSAAAWWGAVALLARHLEGRLASGEQVRQLAAAMPPQARAAPVPGHQPPLLPDPEPLVQAFLAALTRLTGLAGVAAGHDTGSGVRVSLRIDADQDVLRAVPQVHRLADPAQVTDAAALWTSTPDGAADRHDTLLALRHAAQVWPPLEQLLSATVPDQLELGDDEVTDLLTGAAARLADAGVELHWPRELARDLSLTAVVGGTGPPPDDVPGFLAGDTVFDLDWQVALGGQSLTPAERAALAEAHRPLVRLRDQWVLVDPAVANRLRGPAPKPLPVSAALGAALAGTAVVDTEPVEVEAVATGWLAQLRDQLRASPEAVPQPGALAATLRDYQLRGLRWLARLSALGLGGCLADDMGLGKTVTLIALHLHRRTEPATAGPTLVVCPASLLGNWEREITRFAPGEPVHRFHGTDRSLDTASGGFVLTTYATMRLDTEPLRATRWGLVVADEAQHVKNPASATARALRRIPAQARVALTGTPVENHLSDLWAILDWTTPGLLGPLPRFRARWAAPVESGTDPVAAEALSRLVRPFLLRRRKADPGIAPELPAKTETDRPVALTTEQAGLYEAVVSEILAQVRASHGMQRRGLILKLLTGLKQICNHPAQYLAEPDPRLAGRSGKLELLDELLDTILAGDGAVLVFTQYVAMARLLARHLESRQVPAQLLHGGTPVAQREAMVQRFQAGQAPVFLLSLKAAGTGLNLTRADHVIHYDRWWNPAVEQQATDRAHRIGQTRPVQVHRIIAEGTVEDRIAALLRTKQALADAVLGGGEQAALSELTDAELAALVDLRRSA